MRGGWRFWRQPPGNDQRFQSKLSKCNVSIDRQEIAGSGKRQKSCQASACSRAAAHRSRRSLVERQGLILVLQKHAALLRRDARRGPRSRAVDFVQQRRVGRTVEQPGGARNGGISNDGTSNGGVSNDGTSNGGVSNDGTSNA